MKDGDGNTIIESTFDDSDLPRGIERQYAYAIIVENTDKKKVVKACNASWMTDNGGRGWKRLGEMYKHEGKWRQKMLSWDLWKYERI